MKKIGVIADPHANLSALEAVLDDLPEVDKIICAGDLVGYGPQPNEVIELVDSRDIISVMGNHDHSVATGSFSSLDELAAKANRWSRKELKGKNMKFLRELDRKIQMEEEGNRIFVAHGTPRNPLEEYLYPETSNRALVKMTQKTNADIIILGHTHVPLKQKIQGKLIFNPGAVGQPRDRNPKAGYGILKLEKKREVIQERVSYDIEKTEQEIIETGLPEKFASRLHFGW